MGHRYECALCRQVTVLQHTTNTIQQQQLITVYALIPESDTQPISDNNNKQNEQNDQENIQQVLVLYFQYYDIF